jgi:hypothetical protein
MKWADQFVLSAKSSGVNCAVAKRVHGWPETVVIHENICFVKSISFNTSRRLYFQGVDPNKLTEKGDIVLLCCGLETELRDIFIIPWSNFFHIIRQGESVNTYKAPREYWQYKFKIKEESEKWIMTVQGGSNPILDVSKWRFAPEAAIEYLKSLK